MLLQSMGLPITLFDGLHRVVAFFATIPLLRSLRRRAFWPSYVMRAVY
nr:MAG TPA: hypothetical protein [Caudoviricetes sp.]DAK78986.1 MAG TPA: hypothetical protein [Caudoviricetes sp.]